jgi:hypothetical protein
VSDAAPQPDSAVPDPSAGAGPPPPPAPTAAERVPPAVRQELVAHAAEAPATASDTAATLSNTTAAAGPTAAAAAPGKEPRKKRNWRRRLAVAAVLLVGLAVLFRVAMSVAFPIVLKKVAAGYGLDASYDRFTLSLTGGDVGIGNLQFVPVGSAEPLAAAGYVRATISPLQLLVGKLEVWRVETDGVIVNVDRAADGTLPAIDRVLAAAGVGQPASAPPSPAADKPPAKPAAIDLTSPLRVEGFRLQHVEAHVRDRSLSPPLDATIRLDVRVDDIGVPGRKTRFEVAVSCDPVLDAVLVRGEGESAGATLDATVTATVKGLHLKPLAGYLEPLGVRPVADAMSLRMDARLKTTAAGLAQAAGQLASAAAAATRPGPATAVATGKPPLAKGPAAAPAAAVDALALELTLTKMAVLADGREAAAVDSVSVVATRVGAAGVALASVVVDGVRAGAVRTEAGNVRAAGVELFPVLAAAGPTAATRPTTAAATAADKPVKPPAAAAPADPAAAPFAASLDVLSFKNVALSVDDQFVVPPAALSFLVDEFTVRNVTLDPAKAAVPLKIAGTFRVPGVARVVRVDGTATPFAKTMAVALNVAGEGFSPSAARPYLDLLGLEWQLEDAAFAASLTASAAVDAVSGKVAADLRLANIKFTAPPRPGAAAGVAGGGVTGAGGVGGELFGLDELRVAGATFDPATGRVRVETIEGTGPSLTVRREPDGWLSGLGFRAKPPVAGRQRQVPPSEPVQIKLARVEVGKLAWKGVKVGFEDWAVSPPQAVALGDAGLEINDLTLDLESKDPNAKPGTIRAWLAAPKVAEWLEVKGTVTPRIGSIAVDLSAAGRGITAAGISGYLKSLGIEPLLTDGTVAAHLSATVAQSDAGNLTALLAVDGVRYADGATELAGLDRLAVGPVELDAKANTLTVGAIEVDKPRAAVLRDAEGTLVAGGIRLLPRPPAAGPAQPNAAAVSTATAAAPPVATPATVSPLATAPAVAGADVAGPALPPFVATLKTLRVSGAAIQWTDHATTRPVTTTAHADVTLDDLTLGREAKPAHLAVALAVDGVFDKVTVDGDLRPGLTAYGATLSIAAAGVRGTALEPYLPPGARFTLADGRLATKLTADVKPEPAGGWAANLLVDGVDWKDGASGPPLLKLTRFHVGVPRADVAGNAIDVDEVVLTGLELEAGKAPDGAFSALGLALGMAPPQEGTGNPTAEAVGPGARASGTVSVPATTSAGPLASSRISGQAMPAPQTVPAQPSAPATPTDARAVVARARQALPRVRLGKLDLNVNRVTYRDHTAPAAEPLAVTGLRFRTLRAVELLGADPTQNPPVELELTAQAEPLVGDVRLRATVSPFAQQPGLLADLKLTGIKGNGLFTVAPDLKPKIDASALTNGQFTAHAEVQLKVDRRGPMDIDFGKGFDVDGLVNQVEFRAYPAGPPLLGIAEARVVEARVRPAAGTVRVKSIELVKPLARVLRDKDGLHAAGLVVREAPTPATRPATGPVLAGTPVGSPPPVAPGAPPAPAAPAIVPPPVVAQKPAGEIRIDKLTVSGIDVTLEDRSVDPPMLVPLTALDLEARDLSSLAQFEDKPIRFALSANAGKVTLPKKVKGGVIGAVGDVANVFGGIVGAATGGGKKPAEPETPAKPETEDRNLFAQVAASGKLSLFPKPNGWAKANVSGFEIAALKGLAKQRGVTLSYGTFDLTADVRARGDGVVSIVARPAVTDLSMKDAPDGFIVRYLTVVPGADLNTVLGFLEAADKSITVPLDVTAKPEADGTVSIGGIFGTIQAAIREITGKAILGAPAKAVSGVASVIGLDSLIGGGQPKAEEPIVLSFPPGTTYLEPAEAKKLEALAERLKREPDLTVKTVQHDFGGGDARLAELRANPSKDDAAGLAARLHGRKLELARLRPEVAAEARARLASGGPASAADGVARLQAVDREVARTEDALDRAYDLLRPGADRQAERRTRAAALEMARDRLGVVRRGLADVPNLTERLPRTNPQFAPGPDPAAGGRVTLELSHNKK